MDTNTYLYTGDVDTDHIEKEGITHLIVQDGVSIIYDRDFYHWEDLVSVHIPSSLTQTSLSSLISMDLNMKDVKAPLSTTFINASKIYLMVLYLPMSN